MVRFLIEYGVYVYFEKENLNTMTMESELILFILSSMVEKESHSISKNNKWSIQKRFEQGTYVISYPPYGYINDGGEMRIVPEEAEVVRRIFDDTISGKGSAQIARELTEEGIKSKKGGKWHSATIRGMLRNEKYTGDAIFQKTYTDDRFTRHTITARNSSITAETITSRLSATRFSDWWNRKPDAGPMRRTLRKAL